MSRIIALCGYPQSGKSEVQRYLHRRYAVQPIDDGWPMRDFAIRHCGAKMIDVSTQAGKAAIFEFPGGHRMTMREFLGGMGNAIEGLLGDDVIAAMALRTIERGWRDFPGLSLSSVRRRQGCYVRAQGNATVVEVVRPGVKCHHTFDRYDRNCVDITIVNDGDLEKLEASVRAQLGPLFD